MKNLLRFLSKYKVHHIPFERLLLDQKNPRLREKDSGKNQEELLKVMKEQFDLGELAYSIATNGYFQEEPIIAIPNNIETMEKLLNSNSTPHDFEKIVNDGNIYFTVIEGNRRLSTIKLLLNPELQKNLGIRNWPEVEPKYKETLTNLPVVLYTDRNATASYIGVRHIGGPKKWAPYEKSRYIKSLVDDKNLTFDAIQKMVGDKGNSIRKNYLCYQLISIVSNELDLPDTVAKAKNRFSYLLLALGQKSIKNYIGIPPRYQDIDYKKPIADNKMNNLKTLFSWLFGEGPKIPAVISESRDITNYLSPVLNTKSATEWLESTRYLMGSYERSGGEKELLLKYVRNANDQLGNVAKIISDNLIDDTFREEFKSVENQVAKIKKLTPK